MIFCVYETACYQVLKRIVLSEWMQVWRDLHGHGCDCAQTLGCTTQHSGLGAFYRWRATTQWRDFSLWQIQVGMWTSPSHSVHRILAFSLLLTMVMPMSLGLCLPLILCSLLELFQMNKDVRIGVFFIFFCWWMGLNCWLKISQPSVSRFCGLIVEVFLRLLFWQFVLEEVHGRICNDV